MYLTASNLVYYLLGRGLINPESVVSGDFLVAEVGRRNRNFKVIRRQGSGLFIKQIGSSEQQAVMTQEREAACYRLAASDPLYKPLLELMPRFVDSDPVQHTLTVELLSGGENITEHHQRLNAFPEQIGELLGRGLGAYHSGQEDIPGSSANSPAFPRLAPWIFTFPDYGPAYKNMSGGNTALLNILRADSDFRRRLKELNDNWQYNSLIHGDMKWDNCIVFNTEADRLDFRIVDWELADFGDAAWDVGSIFQAYLAFWILSMPANYQAQPAEFVHKAYYKIESMLPAIRRFWHTYRDVRKLGAAAERSLLQRCMCYCAARLLQTAYEHLYQTPNISSHATTILQVSYNILREPESAAADIFGLGE